MFQQTIGLVMLRFCMHTGCTRYAVLLYSIAESGPGKFIWNEAGSFVLARVSREYMIMLVSEYVESEVRRVRNID